VTPKATASDKAVILPGTIEALEQTVIYPRVNGYVRRWLVDLGDKVQEGQLLAEIDTPELDQDLAAARAELGQAQAQGKQTRASQKFSQQRADRTVELQKKGLASEQELEQRESEAEFAQAGTGVAAATVAARRANVERLLDLKSFARVVAPFAGTIVSRTLSTGALVSAGPGTPRVEIAATDPVRVLLAVPQDVAPGVKTDLPAKLTVREFGGEFTGTIARTSGALDPASRTMLVEVRVPNPDGRLLTGMSGKVSLTLPLSHEVLELPGTAVLTGAAGVRVAIVDGESKLRFVSIVIERDLGATVLVSAGLDGSERVVKNASGSLVDGSVVEAVDAQEDAKR
jgi:membrane fusion protein (multidrug efflux system)